MTSSKRTAKKIDQKGRRTKKAEPTSPTLNLVMVCIRSVAFSVLVSLLLLFISSLILTNISDPCVAIKPISLSILYFASLLCGFIAKKSSKLSFLLSGGASSLSFILFILIASLIIPSSHALTFSDGTKAMLFLITIPTSIAGALLGEIKLVKKRHSPYHKRK